MPHFCLYPRTLLWVKRRSLATAGRKESTSSLANRFECQLIGFADEQIIRLARFERRPVMDGHAGLALSPDGRSLLWTLPEGYNSDIMLVENFR
jgi:hypothetical protein